MSASHTVGPWEVDPVTGDIVSGPFNVAILHACKPEDRQMFAAAPCLLSALKAAVAFYDALERPHDDGEAKLLDTLSAAIAKASPAGPLRADGICRNGERS